MKWLNDSWMRPQWLIGKLMISLRQGSIGVSSYRTERYFVFTRVVSCWGAVNIQLIHLWLFVLSLQFKVKEWAVLVSAPAWTPGLILAFNGMGLTCCNITQSTSLSSFDSENLSVCMDPAMLLGNEPMTYSWLLSSWHWVFKALHHERGCLDQQCCSGMLAMAFITKRSVQ